jgi:hypothetical protein
MTWRMRIIGVAGEDTYPGAVYLEAYDVDAFGGRGHSALTTDPAKALTWASPSDVVEAWREQSTVRPQRPDGKPNRPLTAYTMSPELVSP